MIYYIVSTLNIENELNNIENELNNIENELNNNIKLIFLNKQYTQD